MSYLSSILNTVRTTVLDDGALPRASYVTDAWFPPQFSQIHDPAEKRTRIAMFIASREALFDRDVLDQKALAGIAAEIERYVRSKWAMIEANRAANFFNTVKPTGFVAIIEHAPIGAYGACTQQIKAFYHFGEGKIGRLEPQGFAFKDEQVNECVTI